MSEEGTKPDPLERIADALEKLASDPEIEIEAGPPICPTCGKFDPEIMLDPTEAASGPLSQVIVTGTCNNCHNLVLVVIESYSMHRSRVTAADEIHEREKAGFFSDNVRGIQRTEAREA